MKDFGREGKQAAATEMKQLHDQTCSRSFHTHQLSKKQRRLAMNSLFLLTEKRDGRIKGRAVADARKQRLLTNTEGVSCH